MLTGLAMTSEGDGSDYDKQGSYEVQMMAQQIKCNEAGDLLAHCIVCVVFGCRIF